jgi:hypothetical protein
MTTKDFTEIEQLENGTFRDKKIVIKSVFKTGKHTIQPSFDSSTNWWAGVERLSDREKEDRTYYVTVGETGARSKMNTKITLKDGLVFDLNNDVDRINWEWVKHSPVLAMSFSDAQQSKATFYVHIEGREAEAKISAAEKQFKAMECVMKDPNTNLENRALLLGMDMTGEHPATIKEFLLDTAKKSPEKILRVYRDKSMRINLLFVTARRDGKIKFENEVFKYGNIILGNTEEACIAYLQENRDILELLDREVNPQYFVEDTPEMTPIEKARLALEKKKDEDSKK